MYSCPTPEAAALTSWKREDISQTRQELGLCISQRCLSDRKKSLRSGVWVSACTMQFMKHVFPRLISPRRPGWKEHGHLCTELRPSYTSTTSHCLPLSRQHENSRQVLCSLFFNGQQNVRRHYPLHLVLMFSQRHLL